MFYRDYIDNFTSKLMILYIFTYTSEFIEIAAKKDDKLADKAAAVMPRELVDYTVLAGDAARVADQLAKVMRPEVGSITIRPHAVPGESVEDVVRSFANDVIPRVSRLVN